MYAFLILLAVSLTSITAGPDTARRIVHSRDATAPAAWVPLSQASTAKGEIRWDLLGTDARENFERILENDLTQVTSARELTSGKSRYDLRMSGKLPGCVYYGPSYNHFASEPRESIQELTRSAAWSVRGHVIAITPGFFNGQPFSLLTVQTDRTLALNRSQPDQILQVLYPYAQFKAGTISFCKDDYRFPHIPLIGDELIVFAPRGEIGVEATLLMPDRNYVIFESGDHQLTLPRELRFEDDAPRSLDAVEEAVRSSRREIRR